LFERCDPNSTLILDVAMEESRARHHNWLGTEHLLLAFARRRDLLPDDVAQLLPGTEAVAGALAGVVGPGRPHAELLKALGVDLAQVRSAVRRTFGDEAVQRLERPVHQPWQPWRRPSRRCTSILGGELRVAPRVKQSLERARRLVSRQHHPLIDPAALLLGMVEVEDAMANRLLRDLGVEPAALGAVLRRHVP
jgi:hypothetical protein